MHTTPRLRLHPVDVLQSRVIEVSSNLSHLSVVLTQYDGKKEPTISIEGPSISDAGVLTAGGLIFDVTDAPDIRALGEALIALAARADAAGIFVSCAVAGAA